MEHDEENQHDSLFKFCADLFASDQSVGVIQLLFTAPRRLKAHVVNVPRNSTRHEVLRDLGRASNGGFKPFAYSLEREKEFEVALFPEVEREEAENYDDVLNWATGCFRNVFRWAGLTDELAGSNAGPNEANTIEISIPAPAPDAEHALERSLFERARRAGAMHTCLEKQWKFTAVFSNAETAAAYKRQCYDDTKKDK